MLLNIKTIGSYYDGILKIKILTFTIEILTLDIKILIRRHVVRFWL